MRHVENILGGLAIFLVVIAIVGGLIGGAIYTGEKNNQKTQHMNQVCISKGYAGWSDGGKYQDTRCVR